MPYNNLNRLIEGSNSTRRYFLSLPVKMQLALHDYNDDIHTAEDLRRYVKAVEAHRRQMALSGFDRNG